MGTKTIEQFGKSTKNSIPTIVRLFKSTTTKQINQLRRDTLQRVSTTESDTKSDMESNMKSDTESDTGMGTKTIEQFGKSTKNSIPTIVRLFKSTTTKQINQLRRDTLQRASTPMQRVSTTPMQPLWQRNYYEHIIRNEIELNRIRQYIIDNPKKWKTDENYI